MVDKIHIFVSVYLIVLSTVLCSMNNSNEDSILSLKQVLKSLLNYTGNHAAGRTLNINFSKTYIKPGLQNRLGLEEFLIVDLNTQTNEMCPGDHRECWCGFVGEPKSLETYLKPRGAVFLKICSSESEWINNKDFFVQSEFSALRQILLPNGTKITSVDEFEEANIEQRIKKEKLDENEAIQIVKTSWKSLELNKHDRMLCPRGFGWCWCGIIGDYLSYYNSIKSDKGIIGKPKVVIDCRHPNFRVYEERDCTPASSDSIPWYDKLFYPLLKEFPCGYYNQRYSN